MLRSRHDLIAALRHALGHDAVLTDEASRAVYARDASHISLGRPLCVCLPATVEQARCAVALCAEHGAVWVARGAGTGLAGGALPPAGAVVIATSRLMRLGPVDPLARRVCAEAGVRNEDVSRGAAPQGLHFAPDPSSQAAATIGGNVAANAGGPHCLKVGVTVQHVLRLAWVDPRGRAWTSGRGHGLERGIGLLPLLAGSEGTLGLVTAADLALLPVAAATTTLLAEFPRLDDATAAVVTLLAAGLLPDAVEIVDQPMLGAVEAAFRFGFATDVEAVMVCEISGTREAVAEDAARATTLLREGGAREVRAATDAAERQALWRCRKKAFGAVGRLAPAYVSMDVVVPLGELPGFVRDVAAIRDQHGVCIATAFHAGDGNLHPGVHYDDRDPASVARAHAAADAIVLRALALGGSATGEHGVGVEKRHLIHHQLDAVSARLQHGLKAIFDPRDLCNPDKKLPPLGAVCAAPPPVPRGADFRWRSLTVTAPASTPLAELQAEALGRGLWIPVGATLPSTAAGCGLGAAPTVGEVVSLGLAGPSLLGSARVVDVLVELWAETGAGDVFHAGAPVAKNVAGYDLARLVCGDGGMLTRPLAATFLLRPAPAAFARWTWDLARWPGRPGTRAALAALLRRWPEPTVALFDVTDGGAQVAVLAAGRDRAWDLGRLGTLLGAWAEEYGLPRPEAVVRPGHDLAGPGCLDGLPAWSRGAPDWTLLTSGTAAAGWPQAERSLWQARPDAIWLPHAAPMVPSGWFADPVFRGGQATLPPAPDAGVPRDLLAGIKRLFDPARRLPTAAWLDVEAGL
jgi:glycolate oxidase